MINFKYVKFLICILFGWCGLLQGQNVLNIPISGTFSNVTIIEFLEVLENKHGVVILYEPNKIPFFKRSFKFAEKPLNQAVKEFLTGTTLDLVKYQDHLLLSNKDYITAEIIESIIKKWEDGTFQKPITSEAQIINLTLGDSLQSQKGTIVLSGKITDKYSGEPIIGAIIKDEITGGGTTSDVDGSFQIENQAGRHQYLVSFLGYQEIVLNLDWYQSATLDLQMEVFALNLDEVIVEATANQDKVEETQMGVELISTKYIRQIPSLLGEADVLKSIERLPGVSTVSEATAGFNVRGGNIDQNLILLDDGLLFNASHALGYFSIFNPDAVRSVALYKGSIPSQFGGRLSSVLKVDLKDGNKKKWVGNGSVSLASARIVMDGPVTEKTSLMAGLRRSYSNWLLQLFKNPDIKNSRFEFGDAVLKLSHQPSEKHYLSISGYYSDDHFRYASEFGFEWNTQLLNLKWRYNLSNISSLTTSASVGKYQSSQFIPEGDNASNLVNGISYQKINATLTHQPNSQLINFGVEATIYDMSPEERSPLNEFSDISPETIGKGQGMEIAMFVNDDIKLSPSFSVSAGIRFANYLALGPATIYEYDPDRSKSVSSIINTESVDKNQTIASYPVIEPRISANLKLTTHQSIKVSYNRINQFIHLLSNTVSPTPVDIWQLSDQHLKPQSTHSFSIGYFENLNEKWTYSVEAFYKSIANLPQFKDHAQLLLNDYLETEYISSKGKARGLEFSIEKKQGKWQGGLAYSYSKSEAKTNGIFRDEIINENRWSPAYFDQPHQFNIQLQFQPDPIQRVFIGFTYRSGRPITVPISNYFIQNVSVTHFSARNQFRIPTYQRLDFGYTIDRSETKLKGFKNSFTLSFINLLGRQNPYTIYFRRDNENIQRAYKLSVLGTVFPSLNWNFTF